LPGRCSHRCSEQDKHSGDCFIQDDLPDLSFVLPDLTAPASNQHDFVVTIVKPIIWIAPLVSCAFLPVR